MFSYYGEEWQQLWSVLVVMDCLIEIDEIFYFNVLRVGLLFELETLK